MSLWLIHTKSGKTYTSKTHYPWQVENDQITSVERIINKRSIAIKKSPVLHTFFVKTTMSQDFVPNVRNGTRPPQVEARAVGCYIKGEGGKNIRVELVCNPKTGNVYLEAKEVKKVTKDGF